MLVATFTTATGWGGRQILWDGARFVLDGYGPIPAAGLVDYDGKGFLLWATSETRDWAYAYAQWEDAGGRTPGAAALPGATAAAARRTTTAGPSTTTTWTATFKTNAAPATGARQAGRRPPAWAVILLGLVVFAAAALAVAVPLTLFQNTRSTSREAQVRSGVRAVQVGVESWALDHGKYPDAGYVNGYDLGGYVDPWPTNPYTGQPMALGAGAGDFFYQPSEDGASYRLSARGKDGTVLIDLAGGDATPYY